MKIVTRIVIALLVIVGIVLVGAYFLPNNYSVSNSVEINKPVGVVYAELQDFSKWDKWDPWIEKEPTAKRTVSGNAGTPGQKMSWEGDKIGSGSMTMTWAGPNQGINSDLEFIKPMSATAKDKWKVEAKDGKTLVTWTNTGGLSWPRGRLFGLGVNKMLGDEQRHGLDNLKKYVEAMPDAPAPVASADSTMNKSM